MAICQIWEIYSVSISHQPAAMLPGGSVQNVDISSTHAESAAFDNATIAIRVQSDTDCWILCGKSPVATTSNGIRLLAGETEYFGVPLGGAYKLSVVTA